MELSFKDLKKRDVINLADGRCLGQITDLVLVFPEGLLTGIVVPNKNRKGILKLLNFFDRSNLFIEESKIKKIGSDVILVDLKCGDLCGESVSSATKRHNCCDQAFSPCGSNNINTDDY